MCRSDVNRFSHRELLIAGWLVVPTVVAAAQEGQSTCDSAISASKSRENVGIGPASGVE
jgi:hypothetical protein